MDGDRKTFEFRCAPSRVELFVNLTSLCPFSRTIVQRRIYKLDVVNIKENNLFRSNVIDSLSDTFLPRHLILSLFVFRDIVYRSIAHEIICHTGR